MTRIWVEPMLGSLARWLRIMGYDAPLRQGDWPRPGPEEVVLTRRQNAQAKPGHLYVGSDKLDEQLRQVTAALGLRLDPGRLFTRCLDCNLEVLPIGRDQAADLVPEHVRRTAAGFTRCPKCRKIFWPGSHGMHTRERLEAMLEPQAR